MATNIVTTESGKKKDDPFDYRMLAHVGREDYQV